MTTSVRFTVLGGLRAWRDGQEVDLGARQPWLMVAMLLAQAGQPVAVSELVELLWDADPPPTAVNVVQRHIGAIRRMIEPGLARRAEGEWLVRKPGGYRIAVPAESVDLLLFREKAAHAEAELRAGRTEAAIDDYREALDLWQGRFGEGLGAETHPLFVAVNQERAVVACAAADAALDTPAAASLLSALHAAAAAEPFDEALQTRFLLLLATAGRPAEAIERYHRFRERLVADLGVGPGRELTAAFEGLLREPQVAPRTTGPTSMPAPLPAALPSGRPPVPAQLPPGSALFTGRQAERNELDQMLESAAGQRHGAAVIAVDGMPGVGKTALAVHWAHDVAHRFTDGQLYLDLRGFTDDEPLPMTEALAQLLCALGASHADLPPSTEARAAQFRTMTAGRRLLILLDDVRDADQVRPLIPAAPGSLVIVTGRSRLTSLAAADGALLLTLDVPPADDARTQLMARLSLPAPDGRADDDTVEAVLVRSGRLPLALAIIGTRMSEYAPTRLRDLAGCLDKKPGLDAFVVGDDAASDLRTVFELSYRRLGPEAAGLFRKLSNAGPDVDAAAAAELVGTTRARAGTLLRELISSGLLARRCFHHYTMHDLVRAYAAEFAEQTVQRPRLKLVRPGTGSPGIPHRFRTVSQVTVSAAGSTWC